MENILGEYTFKLLVMDTGVNKSFKGYVKVAKEIFVICNPENRKAKMEDIFQLIHTGLEEMEEEITIRT